MDRICRCRHLRAAAAAVEIWLPAEWEGSTDCCCYKSGSRYIWSTQSQSALRLSLSLSLSPALTSESTDRPVQQSAVDTQITSKQITTMGGRHVILLYLSVAVLHALPVDVQNPQQQQKQQQQQTLPAVTSVHRLPAAEGIEFPNTGFIPGDLTEQLSVDGFFSLWFVFLDDDVFTSGNIITPYGKISRVLNLFDWPADKEFTILAPSNNAPMRPSPTAADKERVRQLLLSHIILGRAVNVSSLDLSSATNAKKSLSLATLGGRQVHLKQTKGIQTARLLSHYAFH